MKKNEPAPTSQPLPVIANAAPIFCTDGSSWARPAPVTAANFLPGRRRDIVFHMSRSGSPGNLAWRGLRPESSIAIGYDHAFARNELFPATSIVLPAAKFNCVVKAMATPDCVATRDSVPSGWRDAELCAIAIESAECVQRNIFEPGSTSGITGRLGVTGQWTLSGDSGADWQPHVRQSLAGLGRQIGTVTHRRSDPGAVERTGDTARICRRREVHTRSVLELLKAVIKSRSRQPISGATAPRESQASTSPGEESRYDEFELPNSLSKNLQR